MIHPPHPYPAYKPSGVEWLGDVPYALGGGPLEAKAFSSPKSMTGTNPDEVS